MSSVPFRIALLKQADVHCQLATAQETPEGDPSKAVEHYLTAMELLTCAVADMFQLTDARKTRPKDCEHPTPQTQRPPAFASPLSEVYLQSVVQHKLQQYEERVKLLLEVIGEAPVPAPYSTPGAYHYTEGKTAAPLPPPSPPTSAQAKGPYAEQNINQPVTQQPATTSPPPQPTAPTGISNTEREHIEASNPWNFGDQTNATATQKNTDTATDSPNTFPSPVETPETVNPRQAGDTDGNANGKMDSANRRFGQEKVADADEAFEDIFSQFLSRKQGDEHTP